MTSMHFFSVLASGDPQEEARLNAFLRSHRVLSTDSELVHDGAASFWAIRVFAQEIESNETKSRSPSIDYRQVLNDADFRVFSKLRTLRKELAAADGVPVYRVLSNEQIAAIVTGRVVTKSGFESIDGIGVSRANKFATPILALMKKELGTLLAPQDSENVDASS